MPIEILNMSPTKPIVYFQLFSKKKGNLITSFLHT
jgi:hypothetical protein